MSSILGLLIMLSTIIRSRSWLLPQRSISNRFGGPSSRLQHTLAMKLNCGIVGLPNVGKSTLFNALVGSEAAQAANFPFCTIGWLCSHFLSMD